MKTLGYIALFGFLQVVSLVLALVGVPICAFLAWGDFAKYDSKTGLWHWPQWAWLWDNEENGTYPEWYLKANPTWSVARIEFTWSALRNSVNNFRRIPGVSKVGRPLYYRTWLDNGGQFYVKAGWLSDGYPALSAGRGRGY